jgi:hypothetical protein
MKQIKIVIAISEDKIATAQKFIGYSETKISDQLEILGILQNLVRLQQDKLNKLDIKN